MSASQIKKALQKFADPLRATHSQRFFKTGKGEYGYGDKFLGITVPNQRKIAKAHKETSLPEIAKLLASPYHEHRLTGAILLTYKPLTKEIYDFYLDHLDAINNWDIVDTTTPKIIGLYMISNKKLRPLLHKLAKSKNLWHRRIAVLATFPFIKANDFTDSLKIATTLLHDSHDLIHKAVGWMLREIGKQNQKVLEDFLSEHSTSMPRTMFRYATERLN